MIVTPVIAALLTLFYTRLTFKVIGLRRKHQISLGTGGNADLERAIRSHGNFAEYVPLGLLLLSCLELNRAPLLLLILLGVSFLVGRIVHAVGVSRAAPGATPGRVLGMVFTLNTLFALAICNLGWVMYQQFR